MPCRNVVKHYVPEQYYHVYNRGVGKQLIFKDDEDFRVMLNLLKRLFGPVVQIDVWGRDYPNFHKQAELAAYCLMGNHFHLLIYQNSEIILDKLMKSLCTPYSMYFNKKYNRVGPIFQSRYKASLIDNDFYLYLISRYIHLNPSNYLEYPYSSIGSYISNQHCSWLETKKIRSMFVDHADYRDFLASEQSENRNFT